METNTFVTETDAKYTRGQSLRSLLMVFFAFSLLAGLGFLITWQTFVFFELIVLLSCTVYWIQTREKGYRWRLEFEGDRLTITNLSTEQSYYVVDIPGSDFVITQSKREANLDYCSLLIKNTVFGFGGIQNCSQLQAYIQNHYR